MICSGANVNNKRSEVDKKCTALGSSRNHPLTPSPEGISPDEFSKYLICFSLKRLTLFSFEAYLYLDRAYSAVEFELLKQKLCLVYEHFVHVIRYLLK